MLIKKKPSHRIAALIGLGLLAALLSYTLWPAKKTPGDCVLDAQGCELAYPQGSIQVIFDQPPAVEEQIEFEIVTPSGVVISDIVVEGDNMYMGKIPVFVKASYAQGLKGWFMLGSCSEPNMRWRMVLSIEGRERPYTIVFTTPAG